MYRTPLPPNATECAGSIWVNSVIIKESQVLTDIKNNVLPQVSWVIFTGFNSDHPRDTKASGGPSWVAAIVNAMGNSPYWADTAIFINWEDWGGWYDHVAPKLINSYEYGFRVPSGPMPKPAVSLMQPTILAVSSSSPRTPTDFLLWDMLTLWLTTSLTVSTSARTQSRSKPSAPLDAAYFFNYTGPRTEPDDE